MISMTHNLKPKAFMRINLLTIGLGLALAGTSALSGHAAGMKSLAGHVPQVISRLHLQSTGDVPGDTNLDLAIGLPLHNREGLTNLLQQMYDPASPGYHQYLSPAEFAARFGPTAADYQAVLNFAATNGLQVTGTYSNQMLLDVHGKVSDIQRAFHVKLRKYHHPKENRDFYAPDVDPSVDSSLPVQDISGLSNYGRPTPRYKIAGKSAKPAAGSGPGGSYLGNDFRNAYVPGASLNGANQTIALVQFDGYFASDIVQYETLAGRTNVPLQNVLLDGFNGSPTGDGGEVEVSLDIEMCISMAPALAKVVLYEGNPFNFVPNDVLNRIAADNSARQISCSWGWSGGPSATTDQIFQQMALQGQTFYDAVGDSDAFTAGAGSVNGVDNPFIDNAPSDNPYITQVGGTTLTVTGTNGAYSSETVWNWDIEFGTNYDGEGSSGGISSFYTIPYWQTNINMSLSRGSSSFRNIPDVAMTADNVLVIADGGEEILVGGTSCASPLWAGFTALANQQAAINGHVPLGFINPALYAIAASPTNYANCFRDITTGNNTWSASTNLFYATNGFDLCTGLGSPNGNNLINVLVQSSVTNAITHISAPVGPYGTTLSAMNGGNPNGTWELFLDGNNSLNSGVISNGWSITLTTGNPIGSVADLAVTETSLPGTSVVLGSNVVCTITVTNYGPSISSNAVVTDVLPNNADFVSASPSIGSVVVGSSTLTWNVGTLNTNAGGQLTLTLQTDSNGNFINSVFASAFTADPNSADDSASISVAVSVPSPPQISGTVVSAGGNFQLNITGSAVPTIIQASTNLVTWVPVYTNTAPFTFTDQPTPGYPYRFYRAVQ
jgi:uncharacterized repeat protein (TIGR01451 family)